MKKWAKDNNKIVVAVLHDLNLVQSFGERALMLKEGKLINSGITKEVLNGEDLEEVYGIDIKEVYGNDFREVEIKRRYGDE